MTTLESKLTPEQEQAEWIKSLKESKSGPNLSRCVLNQPLMMVIPPEGTILRCECHPAGHFIRPHTLISM
jgi:hypothetical protein